MKRYCFYIDGFNVYHALQEHSYYHKYKWLDYHKLAKSVISAKDTLSKVYLFTAYVHWKKDVVIRHQEYIKALRSVGVEIIMGRFLKKDKLCHKCNQIFTSHEEKQSDVNIALQMISDAVEDKYDRAVIISADSDLLPVIKTIQYHRPEKEIGVMLPIGLSSFDLRQNVAFRFKMKESLLKNCQFPDEINIGGAIIKRPATWR